MSYILDALRRSQAERERGQVPGLDARPAAVAAVPVGAAVPRWPWVALAAAAVAVLALAWSLWPGTAPPAPAAPTPEGVAVAPRSGVPEVASPAATARPVLPVVVSAPVPPVAPVAPPPDAAPVAVAKPAPPAALAATPLSALTPAQRREWPTLVLGGSIWSDSALSRFVIVNGQVVREGEPAAPGVVVDRIGTKVVWLRWRDLRVEVPL
ncbi:MAG: hypothetical protein C0505_07245 [Leptothrix sp. (in: Bacteria)]|nr:hypothetical protein [Leptothrix sp. (in: b-proteobacteria)]